MPPSIGRSLRALPLLCLMALLTACGARIDHEAYERIRTGMSGAQVRAILGRPSQGGGFELGDAIGLQAGTWIWQEDRRKIIVVFKDDEVLTKHKQGF